ncbi:MAG: BrnT family toxin [Oscillospiraceae bacterium]|nr:BrnT family toxin [Oscillospiraceae bacterium]
MFEIEGQIFDWDINKNLSNIEKHGVPFKEAATVFRDTAAVVIDDTEHSQNEERFKIIGHSGNLRLLMVCHCYREDNSIIRIISARKATKIEQNQYGREIK